MMDKKEIRDALEKELRGCFESKSKDTAEVLGILHNRVTHIENQLGSLVEILEEIQKGLEVKYDAS